MAWSVISCLLTLRSEFNTIAPNRDKGADGTIGDSSHTSVSDHTPDEDSDYLKDHDADDKNEVHALDIDSSGPWPGTGTQKQRFHRILMKLIALELEKWLDSADKCRLNYMIWDGLIYDKDADFVPRVHTGPDPHTSHAHFSGRYETSCENDDRPWGVVPINELEGLTMAELDDYFASAAKACGGKDMAGNTIDSATITSADRQRRFNLTKVMRFALGENGDAQAAGAKTVSQRFTDIDEALTEEA